MNQEPLISVLLPLRNNEQFLLSCLESLLVQNYQNIEIIAVDDYSTDNSLKILNGYKNKDKRIKVFINVKKYGLATTLNRAIKKSRGKFVAFMDANDTIKPNKFVKQLAFLEQNKKVVAAGTQAIFINDKGKQTSKSSYPLKLSPLNGISILMETVMINRFAIPKDLLHFPVKYPVFLYSDMAIKLMKYGEIANLPEFLHVHKRKNKISSLEKQIFSLFKLWILSRFQYGISLPLRSLFSAIRPAT